jgi:N-methylhydantoinase A/oxoprolinase/acetone carboxylase beta subunit
MLVNIIVVVTTLVHGTTMATNSLSFRQGGDNVHISLQGSETSFGPPTDPRHIDSPYDIPFS